VNDTVRPVNVTEEIAGRLEEEVVYVRGDGTHKLQNKGTVGVRAKGWYDER